MPEKPSWHSSTLSQIAIGSVACYLLGALWVLVVSKDIAPLRWAAEVFGAGYLASRARNGGGRPNGQTPPVVPITTPSP